MDEAEIREALEQKQQNPRLQRIPLNLGTKFIRLSILEKAPLLDNTSQLELSSLKQQSQRQVEIQNILMEAPVILLFFGSQWCNVTKGFSGMLQKHYEQINLQKKNLEIIYVSFDKSKKDFENFTRKMPWLGISFEDQRVKDLKQFYNIRSIPSLILIDGKGELIFNDCRTDIYELGQDEAFEKWQKLKNMEDGVENEENK